MGVAPIFNDLQSISGDSIVVNGQGFVWGGAFAHHSQNMRALAVDIFRKTCLPEKVSPYFVPHAGGFMFTPLLDSSEDDLLESGRRLSNALEKTMRELRADHGWRDKCEGDPLLQFSPSFS